MFETLKSLLGKHDQKEKTDIPPHPFSLHRGMNRRPGQNGTTQHRDPFGFFPQFDNPQRNRVQDALNNRREERRDPFGFFQVRNSLDDKETVATDKSEKDIDLHLVESSKQDEQTRTLEEWRKVAEAAAPLIEQYGPMLKKIPAMLASLKKTK